MTIEVSGDVERLIQADNPLQLQQDRLPISNPDSIHFDSQVSKHSSTQCSCLLKSCNRIFTPNHPDRKS